MILSHQMTAISFKARVPGTMSHRDLEQSTDSQCTSSHFDAHMGNQCCILTLSYVRKQCTGMGLTPHNLPITLSRKWKLYTIANKTRT